MGEFIDPETDYHVGPSRHGGMNGILPQKETKGGIIRIRGDAPDGVTGINVLQADLLALLFEMGIDPIPEENSDVLKAYLGD